MKSLKKVYLFLGLFLYFPGKSGLTTPPLTFNQRVIQIRESLQNSQTPATDKTLINFFETAQFHFEKSSQDWENWSNWDNFANWMNWINWGNY